MDCRPHAARIGFRGSAGQFRRAPPRGARREHAVPGSGITAPVPGRTGPLGRRRADGVRHPAWSRAPAASEKSPFATKAKWSSSGRSIDADQPDHAADANPSWRGACRPGGRRRSVRRAFRSPPRPGGRGRRPRIRAATRARSTFSIVAQVTRSSGARPDPSCISTPAVGTPSAAISWTTSRVPASVVAGDVARVRGEVARQLLGGVVVAAREHLADDCRSGGGIDVRDLVRGAGRRRPSRPRRRS